MELGTGNKKSGQATFLAIDVSRILWYWVELCTGRERRFA
jgi:hypothetical protein